MKNIRAWHIPVVGRAAVGRVMEAISILRRVGECGVSVGFEQRGMWGYGSHTSERKILLPTYQVLMQ